ncbi:unnamed protein product [Dracunculus medinensis]|uniref:Cysteine-rich PDZ-binding protein n=1 Tax=Dracunculus medinensis TaxID=318479 RepID=A0A0N4UEH0_DRAME|nr:unnamed protein product [Dracunculus medinensis]
MFRIELNFILSHLRTKLEHRDTDDRDIAELALKTCIGHTITYRKGVDCDRLATSLSVLTFHADTANISSRVQRYCIPLFPLILHEPPRWGCHASRETRTPYQRYLTPSPQSHLEIEVQEFRKCRICKTKVHQIGSHYCQQCAYQKAICAMCGKKMGDTKKLKMSSV